MPGSDLMTIEADILIYDGEHDGDGDGEYNGDGEHNDNGDAWVM